MEMTVGGIIFMAAAWVAILSVNGYCMYKVLGPSGPSKPDNDRHN